MAKISQARQKANAKWNAAHKEQMKKYMYKSHAKTFIRKYANTKDLKELQNLIAELLQGNR